MEAYSEGLLRKPRFLIGTKLDAADAARVKAFRSLPVEGEKLVVSSVTRSGIEDLKRKIVRVMENSHGS
jgi:GTPase involved in cell partitioning and DNA repair